MTKNCGYDDKGNKVDPPCVWCPTRTYGKYIDQDGGFYACENCEVCSIQNRETRTPCTPESNAICGKCLEGYREAKDGCERIVSTSQEIQTPNSGPAIRTKLPTTFTRLTGVLTAKASGNLPLSKATKIYTAVTKAKTTSTTVPVTYRKGTTTLKRALTSAKAVISTQRASTKAQNKTSVSQPTQRSTTPFHVSVSTSFRQSPQTDSRVHENSPQLDHKDKKREMREHFLLVAVIGFSLIVFFIVLIVIYIKLRYSKKKKQNTEVESRKSQELTAFKSDIGAPELEQFCEGQSEYFPREPCNKAVPMDQDDGCTMGLIDGKKSEHSTSQVKVFQQNATENSWNGSMVKKLSSDAMRVEHTKADSSKFKLNAEGPKRKCFICRQTSTKLTIDRRECDIIESGLLFVEKKIEELGECQKTLLREKLDMQRSGIRNWKEAAQYFCVPRNYVDDWKSKIKAGESPSESLIVYLVTKNTTVLDMLLCLRTLGRDDAYVALCEHLKNKCKLCEREERITTI
eukprot:gene839-10583_t